jgi:hypothetical protein
VSLRDAETKPRDGRLERRSGWVSLRSGGVKRLYGWVSLGNGRTKNWHGTVRLSNGWVSRFAGWVSMFSGRTNTPRLGVKSRSRFPVIPRRWVSMKSHSFPLEWPAPGP